MNVKARGVDQAMLGESSAINIPTSKGSHFPQRAQERMISRKPTANTNDSRITAGESMLKRGYALYRRPYALLIPAAIVR